MNKEGIFTDDFRKIKTKSDDAVFEMFANKQNKNDPVHPTPESSVDSAKQAKQGRVKLTPNRKRATPNKSTKASPSESKKNSPANWGKPTTLFNTRIPQELSDLLDDLVYKSKKSGTLITKQAIAIYALTEFVRTNGLLR